MSSSLIDCNLMNKFFMESNLIDNYKEPLENPTKVDFLNSLKLLFNQNK
jgi:hypothetical protein